MKKTDFPAMLMSLSSGGHCACSSERRKQCTYSHTHTEVGWGENVARLEGGGEAAFVLGTYVADSDFRVTIRSRRLGFATAALPPSSCVTQGK